MAPGVRQYLPAPAPQPPLRTLVSAARIIEETDDRWLNGAQTWPYPCGKGQVRNFCSGESGTGSSVITQEANDAWDVIEALTVYECYSAGLDPAEYRARAVQLFTAQEAALVEAEFLAGVQLPNNPHLADSGVSLLNSGAATSLRNGLALLEDAIAAKARRGMIHVPSATASQFQNEVDIENGQWVTKQGTIAVPGAGYDGTVTPSGGAAVSGTEEWAYASGMVEIRRSEVEVVGDISNWLDRSTNKLRIHVHRYYLVTWDHCIHAAVKIDRCKTTC